jgi:hypothetical protein
MTPLSSTIAKEPHLLGKPISGIRHMCVFIDSRDQQYDILLPFLREGLEQNNKILNIVDPLHMADHCRRLSEGGFDVDSAKKKGQLGLFAFQEAYLLDGYFSADRMVALVESVLDQARKDGYPMVRGFGEMHWAVSGLPGTEELVEYESRVNYVYSRFNDPLLCVYDVAKFSGRVVTDILCTHPKVVLNGMSSWPTIEKGKK